VFIHEDYFKDIFNTVREGIIILDDNLKVMSANRSFFNLFKVDAENTIGSVLYDLGNGQWNIPALRVLLEDILSKNTTVDNYEIIHDFESIGQKIMLLNASKIVEKENDRLIILLAIEDITERKEIETGLEKTRKELAIIKRAADEASEFSEGIINTVREPLISLDQDLRVVAASRSFYDFFKVKPEDTVGQLIYDLGNKQWDIPKLRELLETILPQETTFDNYEVEHDFVTIGRRTMLLNARQIELGTGQERIILLAIEDITERKRHENLITESEERYRRIFETASDGIVLLNKCDGSIAYANQAVEKMLGYSEKEYMGKSLQDIGVSIDMSDFSKVMQSVEKDGIVNYVDVSVKTRSGQYIYMDIYLVDRASLAQCNMREITERKKLEAQLLQAQKMEAVGTLAGGIAHDFNNILNVIMGYGGILMERIASDSASREQMHEILSAAERAANLTRQLLVFSRKQAVVMNAVDVNGIISGIQKMLSRLIGEHIELHVTLATDRLTVLADTGQIEQVLINLAANARDAMPNGGHLTISTETEKIDDALVASYGYGKPGTYAIINIADTGTGMDAETQMKIFEPFFTTKEVGEGTGLGLSISYGIVTRHKGQLTCYSEPGKGTLFRIYLPVIEDIAASDIGASTIETIQGGPETILLAEDDLPLRELARKVLESFGYNVIIATNGEEAVEKFMVHRDQIKLVLLDLIMPRASGIEVYEDIKKTSPGIKVLFMSGYTRDMISRMGPEAEIELLRKPFASNTLLRKVREVLDRKNI
jgi:PAS domain S-box-containing protein